MCQVMQRRRNHKQHLWASLGEYRGAIIDGGLKYNFWAHQFLLMNEASNLMRKRLVSMSAVRRVSKCFSTYLNKGKKAEGWRAGLGRETEEGRKVDVGMKLQASRTGQQRADGRRRAFRVLTLCGNEWLQETSGHSVWSWLRGTWPALRPLWESLVELQPQVSTCCLPISKVPVTLSWICSLCTPCILYFRCKPNFLSTTSVVLTFSMFFFISYNVLLVLKTSTLIWNKPCARRHPRKPFFILH